MNSLITTHHPRFKSRYRGNYIRDIRAFIRFESKVAVDGAVSSSMAQLRLTRHDHNHTLTEGSLMEGKGGFPSPEGMKSLGKSSTLYGGSKTNITHCAGKGQTAEHSRKPHTVPCDEYGIRKRYRDKIQAHAMAIARGDQIDTPNIAEILRNDCRAIPW
jgi:hypothetical protein